MYSIKSSDKRYLPAALALILGALSSASAAISSDISQTGFGDPVGGNVDLTSGSFISWAYDTDGLPNGFSNFKSGTTPAAYSTTNTINNLTETGYGWNFSFNDGDSPATGTGIAASGGMNGIAGGEAWQLTFNGVVSSEARVLTVYLGLFAEPNGNDSITENITPTLTGGSLDEVGGLLSYTAIQNGFDDSDPLSNTTGGYVSAVYTITFSSMTETDLVLNFAASDRNGTASAAVSGYTLAAIPEPSAYALLAGMLGFTLVMLRRRQG